MKPSISSPFSVAVLSGSLALTALPAAAQDMYISGSLGLIFQGDSTNSGFFTHEQQGDTGPAFVTGEVTGVSPPLEYPAGTTITWDTEFDQGSFYSVVLGWDIEIIRMELEYSRSEPDVDAHKGISIEGMDLSSIDAGVLINGNVGDLGLSVEEFGADGRGRFKTKSTMLNFIKDFDFINGPVTPYAGIGLGMADTSITYRPSDTEIVDEGDNSYAWQLLLGATYSISDIFDVYANYRYRDMGEPDIDATLFPASFNFEDKGQVLDLGIRYKF